MNDASNRISWAPVTLEALAAACGGVVERGTGTRRVHAFVPTPSAGLAAPADAYAATPALDRFCLVAVPAATPGRAHAVAALLAAAESADAVALVGDAQPVPASLAVIRVPGVTDAVVRLAASRRRASRARVAAVVGSIANIVAEPLAAALRRRWRAIASPTLEETLLALAPATERAVVAVGGGDLVTLAADLTLAAPSLVVLAPPRPGDLGAFELAPALSPSATVIADEDDPRIGLLRATAPCRVMTPSELGLARPVAPSGPSLVPGRAAFPCRGLAIETSLPAALLPAARLAAAAALAAGTDPLDVAEAFARLVPASMPRSASVPSHDGDANTTAAVPALARTA